jgi:hypothetical protein
MIFESLQKIIDRCSFIFLGFSKFPSTQSFDKMEPENLDVIEYYSSSYNMAFHAVDSKL